MTRDLRVIGRCLVLTWWVFAIAAYLGLLAMLALGARDDIRHLRDAKAGRGEYRVNPTTGVRSFHYYTEPNP